MGKGVAGGRGEDGGRGGEVEGGGVRRREKQRRVCTTSVDNIQNAHVYQVEYTYKQLMETVDHYLYQHAMLC